MQYHYIAGQTPLDEEEKRDLTPNIVRREDLDAFEQENILEARKWIMQKSGIRNASSMRNISKIRSESAISASEVFSENFLLNLHKRMYGHVWKWAGRYRKTNKNIGVEAYLIPTELHQLLGDARYWLEHKTYSITDLAIIFHHRLVKIHLFPNGNGRHARLCADVIIAKYSGDKLTWGGNSDLTKPDEIRKRYISALREADRGDYEPLLKFARS